MCEHVEEEMDETGVQENRGYKSIEEGDQISVSHFGVLSSSAYLKDWSGSSPLNPPKAQICSMEQVIVGGLAVLLAPEIDLSVSHKRTGKTIEKRHTWKIGVQWDARYQLHTRGEPSAQRNQSSR